MTTVQSFDRGLRVLEALNQKSFSSLDDLHVRTGLPKSTIARLLTTLAKAGYARRISRAAGYALTPQVLQLSSGVRQRDVLVDRALPLMEAFTQEHKWQVNLSTREGTRMSIRATTYHVSPFQQDSNGVSRDYSMLLCAMGRAYIAACSQGERESVLKAIRASTPQSGPVMRELENIEAIIHAFRMDRYASIKPPRRGDGQRRLAVPVMTPGGDSDVVAVLAMYWYPSVMTVRQAAERYLGPLYGLANRLMEAFRDDLGGDLFAGDSNRSDRPPSAHAAPRPSA